MKCQRPRIRYRSANAATPVSKSAATSVKKRSGGYRVDWRDKKGNRYRETFVLKKDADDSLADIKVQTKAGTYVAPKAVPTLREVAEQWFANKRGQKLRPATPSCYRVNLDRHILRADFAD